MDLIIRGGRIIDPGHFDGEADLYINEGRIAALKPGGGTGEAEKSVKVIAARGKIVAPGLIDLHVHLREPGEEYKETIASGCRAAVAGGFTAVCAMPNTHPPNDCAQVTEFILERAQSAGAARVYPVAAISPGLAGKGLTPFYELAAAGAVAFTDDGLPVANSLLMRRALEYARGAGCPVIAHCEDPLLSADGAMNEGPTATRLGLRGIPNVAESAMVQRDIALAGLTGGKLHLAHVSTREAVDAIRIAKSQGVAVTAEAAPHHFTLDDEAVCDYDPNMKMYPPLRTAADRDAIRQGLADGTIDAIASDHAPHSSIEKQLEFDLAANGVIGLETSLPLALKLVHDGVLSLPRLVELMACHPARIIGVPCGLQTGMPADITIIDPDAVFTVSADNFRSQSRNTPFEGWTLKGRATTTIVAGRVVFALDD
ncbi:MAG: dihydroorotase [Desulfobacterales bacterium]|nr:dihydroorotase [Desulfobacterales bacterium]